MKQVMKMTDKFWKRYQEVVRKNVIPYQWKALTDQLEEAEASHAIKNFRIAAGLEQGEYYGMVFQDSDVYKWLESVAYSLGNHPDPELEFQADEVIVLLGQAQLPDGYLNTYYQVKGGLENRWSNIRENHELYCAGHLIEAAVAYFETTGKDVFLNIARRFADYIDEIFGADDGKIKGYPGHEEIELALVRLYLVTEEERYLNLATFFINERGKEPKFFIAEAEAAGRERYVTWGDGLTYAQDHLPVRQQKEAVGHAVRAVYLYSAIADIARLKKDDSLKDAIDALWNNAVHKKMCINGCIGATSWGEAFAENYDLPNDTAYNETCASVGMAFWAKRMIQLEPKGEYGDVLENTVYNGSLCGMDLAGERFLYVNPLEIGGENAGKRQDHKHVSRERQKWFNCACCPPNLARLIGSIGEYFVSHFEDGLYINMYGAGEIQRELKGQIVTLTQETKYPWDGNILFTFNSAEAVEGRIAFRIPAWSETYELKLNGESISQNVLRGYDVVERTWQDGDQIKLTLDMTPRYVYANTKVTEDIGKVALTRGPLVYVAEETDNGKDLGTLWLKGSVIGTMKNEELLPDAIYLKTSGKRLESKFNDLYSYQKPVFRDKEITMIPYFIWGNRGYGELRVWLNAML